MASVSWLYWYCSNISACSTEKLTGVSVNTRSNSRKQPLPCCCATHNSYRPLHQHQDICVGQVEGDENGNGHPTPTPPTTRRRRLMFHAPLIAFAFPQFVSAALAAGNEAVPPDFRPYTDDVNKFMIFIPQDWQVGAGEPNGFKSITAFFPDEEAANSNLSVVITGLGPDFTRMESFGKVEAFADTLVSGLDRSWQRPPGVAAKLIDCKAANGFYYIEYTLQNPGESRKHLFSAIGMASNGWYNRLYTVTGQFVEEEGEKYGSKIEKAVSSFRFI